MVTCGNSAIQSNENINIINYYAYQFDKFKFFALNKLLQLSFLLIMQMTQYFMVNCETKNVLF